MGLLKTQTVQSHIDEKLALHSQHRIKKNIPTNKIRLQMKDELKQQILELRGQLTGNMMEDMEIRDKIHNLEMELNGVKPSNGNIDCVGCGS